MLAEAEGLFEAAGALEAALPEEASVEPEPERAPEPLMLPGRSADVLPDITPELPPVLSDPAPSGTEPGSISATPLSPVMEEPSGMEEEPGIIEEEPLREEDPLIEEEPGVFSRPRQPESARQRPSARQKARLKDTIRFIRKTLLFCRPAQKMAPAGQAHALGGLPDQMGAWPRRPRPGGAGQAGREMPCLLLQRL